MLAAKITQDGIEVPGIRPACRLMDGAACRAIPVALCVTETHRHVLVEVPKHSAHIDGRTHELSREAHLHKITPYESAAAAPCRARCDTGCRQR